MSEKQDTSLAIRLPYWSITLILLVLMETVSFALDRFQVTGNTLHDYDTVTRIAYLRDVMARHGWQHGFFKRINAPYGMILHWTLPFNLVVLGIYKVFALFNAKTALHYAGYWTGTIFRVLICPVAYWAGREILSPAACAFATGMIVFSPFLLDYAHRGAANHHVLLMLDSIVLAGLAFRVTNRPQANLYLPILLGLTAAFCLWTTFELIILIAPLFMALFILWMAQGEARQRQLLLTSAAFSIGTTLTLLIDPPQGGVGMVLYDHVAAPFQTLAALPFIMSVGSYFLSLPNHFKRFRYFAASGTIVSLGWLLCYLSAVHGVQGAMDPYVAREWLNQIEEVQPIHDWQKLITMLGPGLLSLGLIFTWRDKLHRDAALIGMGFLYVLAQLHFRFAGYEAVGAAYFLGYVFDSLRQRPGEFPPKFSRYAVRGAVGLFVAFFLIQVAVLDFHYDVLTGGGDDDGIPDSISCDPYTVRKQLNDAAWLGVGKPDPIVVNEVNDAAKLVYWTNLLTIAGNYHRDSIGIKDNYRFFRDMGDDTAKEIVRRRGADFVLLCGNGNNVSYSFVSQAKALNELMKPGEEFDPQETMYTRLTDLAPPDWLTLRQWPDDLDTDLLLYQVDKAKLAEKKPDQPSQKADQKPAAKPGRKADKSGA